MDIVSLLHPSANRTSEAMQPIDSFTWLHKMDSLYMTFLMFSCALTAVVIGLSLFHLYYAIRYVSNHRIQTDLYYLVFMFPVTAICGLLGMFVPRAATFLYAVALVYLMLCLFVTITLLFNIFGSRRHLSERLLSSGTLIDLRVAPVCFITCLPSFRATEWFMFSQLVGLVSMFVACYGCYVLVPSCSEEVRKYRFNVIFRSVDIAQCLYTIQKFCFDLAASMDFIRADQLLSASAKAQFWTSFMLTWEMLFMSCIVTYLLRPSHTQLFDKYHDCQALHQKHSISNNNVHDNSDYQVTEPDGIIKKFDTIN